jgi:DNA invertase Pin-like site-specific DNA recombinase
VVPGSTHSGRPSLPRLNGGGGMSLPGYPMREPAGKGVGHRPGLAAAIESVEKGQAAALIAAKLDRISRSVLDTATLMKQARRGGWELVTCDLAIDTSTPAGEATASMMAVLASSSAS